MTDPLGESQVIPYLKELSKRGHVISIISFEKKNRFKIHGDRIKKSLQENAIFWSYFFYTKKPPVFSTLYDLIRLRKKAKLICKKNNVNIVHCRSYIASLVGVFLKKKYAVKFLFDMRGFWADERVEGGLWNLKNPLYRLVYQFFKKKEIQFLNMSDATVSLTVNAVNEIRSWKTIRSSLSITVIPCCVDMELFDRNKINPVIKQNMKIKLGITEDDMVLLYLGSIGTWYLLKEMLLFFKYLCTSYPNAKFLFITTEQKKIILDQAHLFGIPLYKLIIKESSRQDLPYYVSMAHAAVFFIKPVYSKKASSPTKQGEIMSMGIPILCNKDIGDTDKIVEENNCGVVVPNFSNDSFDDTIKKIDYLITLDKTKIVETAKNYFSLQNGVEKYNNIYVSLLKNKTINHFHKDND